MKKLLEHIGQLCGVHPSDEQSGLDAVLDLTLAAGCLRREANASGKFPYISSGTSDLDTIQIVADALQAASVTPKPLTPPEPEGLQERIKRMFPADDVQMLQRDKYSRLCVKLDRMEHGVTFTLEPYITALAMVRYKGFIYAAPGAPIQVGFFPNRVPVAVLLGAGR